MMTERDKYIMVTETTKQKIRQVGDEALGGEASGVPLGTLVSMMADDYLGGSSDE